MGIVGHCRWRARPLAVIGAESLEDVRDVWGLGGFGDVVRGGDLLAGVAELCCAFRVGLFLDEGGDGLAEGVGGDPGEVGVGAGIRGAMTWSVNCDVTNGNRFASTVGPHLDALP